MEAEQIIDGTNSSDSSMGNAPIQNFGAEEVQVDVFIPQVNGQPMHFIQEHIHEHELMGGNANDAVPLDNDNNNMQLGFVELFEPSQDPVFASLASSQKH